MPPLSTPSSSALPSHLAAAAPPSLADIKFTTNVATSQDNIVALAPLRWNLVRLGRTWDDKISTLVAKGTREKSEMLKSQNLTVARHKTSAKKSFEAAKAAVPLNKRLEMMQRSYENLRRAGQNERAGALKRRLDPMVKSFYRKELNTHIAEARKER